MGGRPENGGFGKNTVLSRRSLLMLASLATGASLVDLTGCATPQLPDLKEDDFRSALTYLGGRVLAMRDSVTHDAKKFEKQGISVKETTLGDGPNAHRLVTLRVVTLTDGMEKTLQVETSPDGKSAIYGLEFASTSFTPQGTDYLVDLNGQDRAQMRQDSTGVKTIITQTIGTAYSDHNFHQNETVYVVTSRYATTPSAKITFYPNDSLLDPNNLPTTFSKDKIVNNASGEKVLPLDGILPSPSAPPSQPLIGNDSPFANFNERAFAYIVDLEDRMNNVH